MPIPNLTIYRWKDWLKDEPAPSESPTYLGDWESGSESNPRSDDYLWLDLMSGSDYAGSAVEKSNHDVFLEQFKDVDGVLDVYGGYGTYGVLIRRDVYDSNESIRETLARLDSYCVLDEEHMSELERAAEDEAWDDWAASDFRRALAKRFPHLEDTLDDMSNESLREYFESAAEEQNEYWENETGNSAYIDVDKIASAIDESAFESFVAAQLEDGDIAHAEQHADA